MYLDVHMSGDANHILRLVLHLYERSTSVAREAEVDGKGKSAAERDTRSHHGAAVHTKESRCVLTGICYEDRRHRRSEASPLLYIYRYDMI